MADRSHVRGAARFRSARWFIPLAGLAAALPAAAALLLLRGPPAPPPPLPPTPPAEEAPPGQGIEREGLRIEYRLEPVSGAELRPRSPAIARFSIRDAKSGEPVRGLKPLAWMWRRKEESPPDEAGCVERMRTFLGGKLAAQAEVDLNAFLLLAQNDDNSISVINPQIAFARTKLLRLLTLAARPADWALQPDGTALWVTLPETDGLAVVDTRALRVLGTLQVGDHPMRVVVAPDGGTVWVGNDGDGSVTVIDAATRRTVATIATGAGAQRIAFLDRGRLAVIAASEAGTLSLVDTERMKVREVVEIGAGIFGLAASETAGVVVATRAPAGEVAILDPLRTSSVQRIPLEPGVGEVAFDPSGRWAFVLHSARGDLIVLDPSGAIRQRRIGGFAEPDALAFTERFAYVRNRASTSLTLVQLEGLAEGADPAVLEIPIGERPPAAAGTAALASPLSPVPTSDGAFVASPADGTLVYYHEGMMAPMGTHRNYGRTPRAVLVLDRSLRETEPGIYTAAVEMPVAGKWNVGFLLGRPRVAHCFDQPIDAREGEEIEAPLSLEPLIDEAAPVAAGAPLAVRFRLADPARKEAIPPGEIDVVVAEPPRTWQRRAEVRALEEPGVYEAIFEPPRRGRYKVNVAVPARSARLGTLPPITVIAVDSKQTKKGVER